MPSHGGGDGAAEATWRDVKCRVMLAIVLPSHADDGATEETCP
jgi:hypothetical protein